MELSNTEIEIVVKNMAREMVKRVTAKNADKSDYQKFRDMFFQKHGIKSEADAQKYAGTKEGAKLDKEYKEEYQKYMAAKNADEKYPYLEAIKGKIAAEGYKNPTEVEIKKNICKCRFSNTNDKIRSGI